MTTDLYFDRRRALVLASMAMANALLAARASAQSRAQTGRKGTEPVLPSPGAGRLYFTASEFELIEEIAEAIVPADEVSGGAKAAKIAEFLDRQLGESRDAELKPGFKQDIAEIDRICVEMHRRGFVKATAEQRSRVLARISRNEAKPKADAEYAFGTVKWLVTFAYYKSKIGIHDDLKYQGNVLLDEFLGVDPSRR